MDGKSSAFVFPKPKEPIHQRIVRNAKSVLGVSAKPELDGQPRIDPETRRQCQEALRSVRKISKADAVERIRRVTADWNDLTARVLNLPPELFILEQGANVSLSIDNNFGIIPVENYLVEGWNQTQLPKLPEYGIGLSERSSTYMTLVDMSRRIVVRARIYSAHEPDDSKWTSFSNAIRKAASHAEKNRVRDKNQVVVYNDGSLETHQL